MTDFSDRLTTETITHTITLELIDQVGGVLSTDIALEYRPADPYAVTFVFDGAGQQGEPVRWELSRETLDTGMFEPAGIGDVELWPCLDTTCHAVTMVELCGATGSTVVLQVQTSDLRRFLEATYDAVPRGTESALLDLDGVVSALLGHPRAG